MIPNTIGAQRGAAALVPASAHRSPGARGVLRPDSRFINKPCAAQSVDIDVMERRELVRRLVLNSICGDFENVDQIILRDVTRAGSRFEMTIERSDIVDALKGLIEDGFAKAYRLSGSMGPDPFAGELPGMPSMDIVEENFQTYFYITKKGMDFHLADKSWWLFDDEAEMPE